MIAETGGRRSDRQKLILEGWRAETGGRRSDRQKLILEGWRKAVSTGRYAAIRYDCASPSVAQSITDLAKKVGFTRASFWAAVQPTADEIAALSPVPVEAAAAPSTSPPHTQAEETRPVSDQPVSATSVGDWPRPVAHLPAPEPETAQAAAHREQRYREIFGMEEPSRRRRWRR